MVQLRHRLHDSTGAMFQLIFEGMLLPYASDIELSDYHDGINILVGPLILITTTPSVSLTDQSMPSAYHR